MEITREQALRFRHHHQRLGATGPTDDCPVLDLGVQDTGGPHAARWALAVRGCEIDEEELILAWTLRLHVEMWDGGEHPPGRDEQAERLAAQATGKIQASQVARRVNGLERPTRWPHRPTRNSRWYRPRNPATASTHQGCG